MMSLALNIHAKQTAIQAICQTMNGRYSNRWCRRHGVAVVLERSDMREVVNAIFYIGSTGCQWRALPKDFPPMTTVQGYFYNWRNAGVLEAMNDLLVVAARELADRAAEPTAGVIDSQSVKTTESGGICGYDAGKKTKGRKRHIVTDVLGLLLMIVVHAANIQDRDGAPDLLKAAGKKFPCLRHIFTDGGYAGDKLRQAMVTSGHWKQSSDLTRQKASFYCPCDGSLSVLLHGWAGVDG